MRRSNLRSSFAPSLQVLEGRECPAGISLANGVLTISGNAGVDTVTVTQDDATNAIIVRDGFQVVQFRSNHVSVVNVGLDAGNDEFRYELASNYTQMKHVTVWLGADRDLATFDFGRNNAHAVLNNLYLNVAGMNGDDTVDCHFGNFNSTSTAPDLNVAIDLGSGNDSGMVQTWGRLGPGADVDFSILGNSDDDYMYFNHHGGYIDALASLDVAMDGGFGQDKASVEFTGELDGKVHMKLDGGIRGDDVVGAQMLIAAGSRGTLDMECYGGTGADEMGMNIDDQSGGSLVLSRALLDGGTGVDRLLGASGNVLVVNIP